MYKDFYEGYHDGAVGADNDYSSRQRPGFSWLDMQFKFQDSISHSILPYVQNIFQLGTLGNR